MRIQTCGKLSSWLLTLLLPGGVWAQSSYSISGTTVQAEGNGGYNVAVFTVNRSEPGAAETVQFRTEDGTATGGSSCGGTVDYVSLSGSLAFAAVETTKTITISTCGDTKDEPSEAFHVSIIVPGATTKPPRAAATIIDDDPAPSITIADTQIVEGNALSSNALFTVSLSAPSGMEVEVGYKTIPLSYYTPPPSGVAWEGSSSAGGIDYIAGRGRLKFPRDSLSLTISVSVCGDINWEPEERFKIVLSDPRNATIEDSDALCRILNDDPPELSILDVTVVEPSHPGELVEAEFLFSLTSSEHSGASIHFQTVDGTAVSSTFKSCDGKGDFILRGGAVQFYPGNASPERIRVPICFDRVREGTETFQIRLSNPIGLVVRSKTPVGTILDNSSTIPR